jgi:hypothetical protein
MATINKVTDVIAAIKTIYPYYAKEASVEVLATTWATLLQPYDDKVVDAALYKCLQICKMPPTPADIIEQINSSRRANEPSNEELWWTYQRALVDVADQVSRFNYTFVDSSGISQGEKARRKVEEIWQGLPEKVKGYLASKGELIRNAREYDEDIDFANWEKQRFIKAMPVMEKRIEYHDMIGGGTQAPALSSSRDLDDFFN